VGGWVAGWLGGWRGANVVVFLCALGRSCLGRALPDERRLLRMFSQIVRGLGDRSLGSCGVLVGWGVWECSTAVVGVGVWWRGGGVWLV